MCGLTNSNDGNVSGFHTAMFDPDIWVSKCDASGNFLWQRCCGGSGQDESFRIYEESPNVYVVTGFTYSPDYDVTDWKGDADGWIIRVTGSAGVENSVVNIPDIFPNPVLDKLYLDAAELRSVRILNVFGELVFVPAINKDGSIDVASLPAGVYIIELSLPAGYSSQKFVKL
jgi:hypothetical protein